MMAVAGRDSLGNDCTHVMVLERWKKPQQQSYSRFATLQSHATTPKPADTSDSDSHSLTRNHSMPTPLISANSAMNRSKSEALTPSASVSKYLDDYSRALERNAARRRGKRPNTIFTKKSRKLRTLSVDAATDALEATTTTTTTTTTITTTSTAEAKKRAISFDGDFLTQQRNNKTQLDLTWRHNSVSVEGQHNINNWIPPVSLNYFNLKTASQVVLSRSAQVTPSTIDGNNYNYRQSYSDLRDRSFSNASNQSKKRIPTAAKVKRRCPRPINQTNELPPLELDSRRMKQYNSNNTPTIIKFSGPPRLRTTPRRKRATSTSSSTTLEITHPPQQQQQQQRDRQQQQQQQDQPAEQTLRPWTTKGDPARRAGQCSDYISDSN